METDAAGLCAFRAVEVCAVLSAVVHKKLLLYMIGVYLRVYVMWYILRYIHIIRDVYDCPVCGMYAWNHIVTLLLFLCDSVDVPTQTCSYSIYIYILLAVSYSRTRSTRCICKVSTSMY